MKAQYIGRQAIKIINNIVNIIVLMIILLLSFYAAYALWDSEQIYYAADKSHYAIYKPTPINAGKTFKELQAINPEVFAWLSVYGTNIDYPVTQGPDNQKYVNTNAECRYSLSGAIFLDSGNSKDFSDFNNILYGHHMEKKAMFGEIGSFASRQVFNTHQYGNLYFDGKDHGIEFFAFVHADAYDGAIFKANVKGEERQAYLDGLLAKALHKREISITVDDHIIMLSTCSSSSTNGRDILIGKITDELYEDTFIGAQANEGKEQASVDRQKDAVLSQWLLVLMLTLLLVILIELIIIISRRRKQVISQ